MIGRLLREWLCLPLIILLAAPTWALVASEVAVVYNTNSELNGASEGVARYYAEARGVPPENLVPIETSATNNVYSYLYVPDVATPIWDYLSSRPDIKVILLCYGVPYYVSGTRASIDAALTLLGNPGVLSTEYVGYPYPYITNPYYGKDVDFGEFRDSPQNSIDIPGVGTFTMNYLVSRLDGLSAPTETVTIENDQFTIPRDVKLMIDRAVSANANGKAALADARAVLDDARPYVVGRIYPRPLKTTSTLP